MGFTDISLILKKYPEFSNAKNSGPHRYAYFLSVRKVEVYRSSRIPDFISYRGVVLGADVRIITNNILKEFKQAVDLYFDDLLNLIKEID